MSGSPAAGLALGDLMDNYPADIRFAVARVIVGQMTKDGHGRLSIPFPGITPTAFTAYGEFVLATQAQTKGYARGTLLRSYENVRSLIQDGHVQWEAMIPMLTALLTAPDAHIDLRTEAAQLLFWPGYHSDLTTGRVEDPALWAIRQEDPLLRLAYLANLAEINRPQQNWRNEMEIPHIGQLYGLSGSQIGLVDPRTGIAKIYPRIEDRNWLAVVRQFQDWERSGRNDPRVIAAAQTILDGAEFSYEMAFQA